MIIEGTLRYQKNVYQQRVSSLDNLTAALKNHLDRLNGYKAELPSIWQDEESARMISIIETMINQITKTMNNVERSSIAMKDIVSNMDTKTQAADDIMDDASKFLGLLGR